MSLWLINNPFVLPVRPCRTLDQHCSMCLKPEELVTQLLPHEFRNLVSALSGYYPPMPCRQDSGSTVSVDKDKFQINFDIQQFKPEEISVKVTADNLVVIEGKHEEKQDEHGSISKQFVRKYVLPEGHDISKIESKLSSDGVLTITAPKVTSENCEYRNIPITQTGQLPKPAVVDERKDNKTSEDPPNNISH